MVDRAQHKMLLTRYVLGQVSPEERADLEGQYVDDDELFDELIATENDLIDDYVRGRLGPQEKPFEACFLSSPQRRERVEFAKSVMAYGSAATDSKSRVSERRSGWQAIWSYFGDAPVGMRLALATLLLLAMAGSSWLVVVNRRLHQQIEAALDAEAQTQRQTQELGRRIAEVQEAARTTQTPETLAPPGLPVLSLTLAPDLARSANQQQNVLPLPRGISQVRLLLKTTRSISPTYSVILETAEGTKVWTSKSLASQPVAGGGSVIVIQIPPKVFKHDDYVLRLFLATSNGKADEVGTYSFRVAK